MAKRASETKKAVIFIVEGSSDKKALEKIFQKIYKSKNIVFKFTNGDITSDEKMNEAKASQKIYEIVNLYMKDKKLFPKDIWQIVHIFDTDGTYIPDDAIIEGGKSEFLYSLYGLQNLNDELKGDYADAFYSVFQGREELFVDFLREEVVNGVPDSFPASWRYIKEGLHSLERHTNMQIYFLQNPY